MASRHSTTKGSETSSGTIKSYFKTSKNVRSRIPVHAPSKKNQSEGTKKTRVRPVPDFSKLHQQWQEKLECGKAVTKKPCTVSQEFDLTRPGTSFTHAVQRELSFSCESPATSGAGNPQTSLCDIRLVDEDVQCESHNRFEPAKGVKRRVLGDLTSGELNSLNKSPRTSSKQKSKFTASLVLQLTGEQHETGENFVRDDRALESILSEQGVQPGVVSPGGLAHYPTRLTEQPSQAPRLSLFGQKASRFSMRELHAGSPGLFGVEPVRVRNSIYMTYKPRPRLQETTPRRETPRPKLQASNPTIEFMSYEKLDLIAALILTCCLVDVLSPL
ncbi:uncharacterized protein LOC135478153 [Liolophura sinensis]|uniref:uncharacterized protein LOC135478153 n=1 Tax=Liolophura sinensis TaxID=3198878 RepID=UPI003158B184